MSGVEGDQISNDIHTSEFNNHNAKVGLNCDDNELNGDVPNNGGIHDQSIEKLKSEAELVNPNINTNYSVDKVEEHFETTIYSGSIPDIKITEDSIDDNFETSEIEERGKLNEEKEVDLKQEEGVSISVNKTDDELINDQKTEISESERQIINNRTYNQGNASEDNVDSVTGDLNGEKIDEKSSLADDQNSKQSVGILDESFGPSNNKEEISKEKHVTFQDYENNYEEFTGNNQADEHKKLTEQHRDTEETKFFDNKDQNSDTSESPSYKPDESGNDNSVKPASVEEGNSKSEASESWPSYKAEREQEGQFEAERVSDEPKKSEITDETEPISQSEASESWPSYQPDSIKGKAKEATPEILKNNLNNSRDEQGYDVEDKLNTKTSDTKLVETTKTSDTKLVEPDILENREEHCALDNSITVEHQVAPADTKSPNNELDQSLKSDQAEESFPSYEREVTPVNICGDDTLDDIEPISTIADIPTEESTVKPADTMDNETEKSDITKSEVADDKARADDAPKRDSNDDTDLETMEDLRSEEVIENKDDQKQSDTKEQNGSQNQNEDEEADVPKPENENKSSESYKEEQSPDENENKLEKQELTKAQEEEPIKPNSPTKEPEPKQEQAYSPEPVPIPVVRNVDLDQTVLTLSDLESTIDRLMTDMKDLMGDYHTKLSAQPLSDFVIDLDKFRGDFISVGEAYKKCETLSVLLNRCLKDLRHSTEDVNILINKKFREEDLATWADDVDKLEEEKEKLREERVAVEKSALAKASEARAAVANATTGVSESKILASEAELEAAETAALAKRAWEVAETARRTAEEAKKAAEEKRKADEEARRRAQERAKIKAEEEKKKREEENVLLRQEAQEKGTTFEDERKRADEEKARKEAERKNPKNWPRNIYSIEPGDFDPGIGCIIRSIDGCLKRDEVEVKRIDQMSGILTLVENEELISNIIEIVPTDTEKKFTFEEPLAIAIPHCFTRGTHGREPIVKTLQSNGKWIEVPTSDVSFEDIKELRFVEMRVKRFGVFAVVSRLKHDKLTFSRKGNKVMSSVDPRITLTCRPGMFKINANFHIEVQPVDSTTISELKHRKPEECANIITSSPILHFHIANRKFSKPVMITMPLPAVSSKPKRPTTAGINREKNDQMSETRAAPVRPGTAFASSIKEEEADEEIHLLVKGRIGHWSRLHNVALIQSKNKDIVTFDLPEPFERLLLLRMKRGTAAGDIEKIAPLLELSLNHRSIQLFLRQKTGAFNNVRLSCANTGRTERFLRNLAEEGYEEGPRPTKDIIVKEGQVLYVRFRGNLSCLTDISDLKFVFNTHIKTGLEFNVVEQDKFAQKSFHYYRGFAKIFTMVKVSKQLPPQDTSSSSQQKPIYEIVDEEVLLAELLINLPKPDPEPPQPLNTAPVKITEEGPVSKDMLEFVAAELGDEWKRLAQFLNLKRMRIQAILRQNNTNPDPKQIGHDMLLSWAKRQSRCVNKVEILAHGLESIGRADISEVLRDRDVEFRRQRADSARDSFLRRAFIKVAQNPVAVKDWKSIAKRLGVPEDDLLEIDQTKPSVQEKCIHSLKKWQTVAGASATLPTLTAKLKVFKHRQLAREIETI